MPISLRNSDSFAESEIAKYLDKYFYSKHVANLTRYSDRETQMLGIDVQFDFKDLKKVLVDEKAAIHYINKEIPTFAFEINFLTSSQQLVSGWLFDNEKKTQYYLICWIKAKKDKDFLSEDITEIEVLLIERASIIRMLAEHNIDNSTAVSIANEIRAKNEYGVSRKENAKPFYFFYTTHLAERPINIIIKKQKLIELSILRSLVKP